MLRKEREWGSNSFCGNNLRFKQFAIYGFLREIKSWSPTPLKKEMSLMHSEERKNWKQLLFHQVMFHIISSYGYYFQMRLEPRELFGSSFGQSVGLHLSPFRSNLPTRSSTPPCLLRTRMVPAKGTPTLKLIFNTRHSVFRIRWMRTWSLRSVLIYIIFMGPLLLMGLIKGDYPMLGH